VRERALSVECRDAGEERNLNCAVYIISNVADDDANTYIYYASIIIHPTVHISLFSCISTLHARSVRALRHVTDNIHSTVQIPVNVTQQ